MPTHDDELSLETNEVNNLGADNSYSALKSAIQAKYDLTAEAYRLKFRCSERQSDQSVKEYVTTLEHLHGLQLGIVEGDYYALFDLMISDQTYFGLPTEI